MFLTFLKERVKLNYLGSSHFVLWSCQKNPFSNQSMFYNESENKGEIIQGTLKYNTKNMLDDIVSVVSWEVMISTSLGDVRFPDRMTCKAQYTFFDTNSVFKVACKGCLF